MSDMPQGPGWWIASDGRWYPPQEESGPAPTIQQPVASPEATAQQPITPNYPPQGDQWGSPPSYQPGAYGATPGYQQGAYGATPGYQPGPYGAPPMPGAPQQKSRAGCLIGSVAAFVVLLVGSLVVIGLLVNTDSKDATQANQRGTRTSPAAPTSVVKDQQAPSDVTIQGDTKAADNELIARAIADLNEYWSTNLPETYNKKYQPVSGGYFAWGPGEGLPPCVDSRDQIEGNAYYCSTEDVVAWDSDGLIPELRSEFGDLAVAVVMAHEYGHVVQARSEQAGVNQVITAEHQADCFAGGWAAHVNKGESKYFEANLDAVIESMRGMLSFADGLGVTADNSEGAHGSGFDRVNAFQDGYNNGPEQCATYTDSSIEIVQLPFTSQDDLDNQGNIPFDQVIELPQGDLSKHWPEVAAARGSTFEPLGPDQPTQGSDGKCGDDSIDAIDFYCPDGNYIGYDMERYREVYDQLGDMGVGTLYGMKYAQAAMKSFGTDGGDAKAYELRSICYVGSWQGTLLERTRDPDPNQTDTERMILSPGDLDESIGTLLALNNDNTNGFERIEAFRNGVLSGIDSCS